MQPGGPPPPPGQGRPPPGYPGYPPAYGHPPPGYGYPPPGYGYPPPGYPVMGQARPGGPRTIGILSIVFGALTAVTAVLTLLFAAATATVDEEEVGAEAFARYVSDTRAASTLIAVVLLVMSVALVIIGRWQRTYLRRAVRPTLGWSLAALAAVALMIGLDVAVMWPAMDAAAAHLSSAAAEEVRTENKIGSLVASLLYLPYPIVLLAMFRRPATVAAMDQPPEIAAQTFA